MEKVFDRFSAYNLRSRLSCTVLLIAPILIEVFFLFPEARELSTTIAITTIVYALCNIAIIATRVLGVKAMKKCFPSQLPAQQYLLPSNKYLDVETKNRYYSYFEKNIANFKVYSSDEEMKIMAETAVSWLIAKTRDESRFSLIAEENMNFGLSYNLLGLKPLGVFFSGLCLLLNAYLLFLSSALIYPSSLLTLCICCDCMFLLLWIFIVNKNLVRQSGKKYARALLSACDQL